MILCQTSLYGLAICCTDHPEVQSLVGRISDRRVVTYGLNAQVDVRAVNLTYSGGSAHFDVEFQEDETALRGLCLPMTGDHNVSNVLSAIAVARHLGVKEAEIKSALENFKGVNRRFTKVGEVDGITIIDDYGHHPVEIAAVLKAARQASDGRVIAVHQPYRYTRLHTPFEDFCTCFNEADVVAIAEVFAAGEDPIEGASRDDLVAGLIRHGHRHASALLNEDDLKNWCAPMRNRVISSSVLAQVQFPHGPTHCQNGWGNKGRFDLSQSVDWLGSDPYVLAYAGFYCGADEYWTSHATTGAGHEQHPTTTRRSVRKPFVGGFDMVACRWSCGVFLSTCGHDDPAFSCALPADIPVFPMGVGSNLIVRDGGLRGVVIRLGRGFNQITVQDDLIVAGAAALDAHVARRAADQGRDLTFLRTIPGSIGGAVRMNAGVMDLCGRSLCSGDTCHPSG